MYILDASTESGSFVLGESASSDSTNVQVICDVENGCFDQNAVTIVDPMGHAPQIFFQRRAAPNAATSGLWRHFTAAIENAEGRKPVFKISRQYRDGNNVYDLSRWRGVQTTDFVTWVQSNTPSLEGGTSGTFNFDFSIPLPAGRSYIAHNVYGRQAEADTFAQWLLTDNASVAAPADPSYTNGVFANSVVENNDLGNPVGGNPRYAIKLSFGGSTTDGKRKRKLVVMYGIHAAGEGQAWWAFAEGIKWVMTSGDTQAQNIRANWDIWLYFNVNPNGIRGGTSRTTPRSTTDPNRNWSGLGSVSSLEEIDTLKRVIHSDVGGQCDTLFSFHGDVYSTNKFQTWVWTDDYNAGTRSPAMQAILDAGQTIWGVAPTLSTSSSNNTDVWFGRQVLGAPISLDSETPSMAGSTTQYFAEIGQNWYKSLEMVDQAGVILQETTHDLTATNLSQTNNMPAGVVTQIHMLGASASVQRVLASAGPVTQGSHLTPSPLSQRNVALAGAISQVHNLAGLPLAQINNISQAALTQIHELAASALLQRNLAANGQAGQGVVINLTGSPLLNKRSLTTGQISQIHNLLASAATQLNSLPAAGVTQAHLLLASDLLIVNLASSGAIETFEPVIVTLQGANLAQANSLSSGQITLSIVDTLPEAIYAALNSLVPGGIHAEVIPQSWNTFPAIRYTFPSINNPGTICGDSDMDSYRVQFDIYGREYDPITSIRKQVIEALRNNFLHAERVNELTMYEEDVKMYRRMLEYNIYYDF